MVEQKQLESVELFKYLGSMLTNDGRFTCEIKFSIALAQAAFNKKRVLFTSTLDLKLRKKLVKCYSWRRMEMSWTDHVRNEEVLLKSQGAEEYPT
jgi:hypothetical protein